MEKFRVAQRYAAPPLFQNIKDFNTIIQP